MADGPTQKIGELRKKLDEFFTKLAAGDDSAQAPVDDIDEIGEAGDVSKQLEGAVADTISEGKGGTEAEAYEAMHGIDGAIKTFNLIKRIQEDRITAFTAVFNNENPNEEKEE